MATSSSSASAVPFSQAQRQFRFETALGKDTLVVASFTCEEAVSRPFRLLVQLISEDGNVPIDKVLRQPATLTVAFPGGGDRVFHGFVSRFTQGPKQDGRARYHAEIVPWLWYLQHVRDYRIFQNMSVPEIVEAIFKEHSGGVNFSWKTIKTYPKREYVVQFRESQFAFVSRLLEEEGIFYFFEHAKDKHTLVLADANSSVKPCPGLSKAVRMNTMLGDGYEQNVVTEMVREHAAHVGKVAMRDYNFLTPTNKLEAALAGEGKEEAFDFPGGYADHGEGERYARIRLEEQEVMRVAARGASNVRAFQAGYKFELSEHYRKDANGPYHLTEVHHAGRAGSLELGVPDTYENGFVAIPFATPFRPRRVTPKPRAQTQSAVVVGKQGEEIWVDKYGRVKVQFHWDRKGKKDENSSCWVRVSSSWAGKQWGFVQIPRIGQEVIVDFLDGDPDRPVIVGSVYNADNMPPWALPANGTQSGVLTRSSKGGSAANANELRFEDKKGSEQVFLHAEKNHDVEVENDETHWVGHDQTLTVDHDRTKLVKNDEATTVEKNRTETVGENETVTIAKNREHNVGENDTLLVGKDRRLAIDGAHTVEVQKDETYKVNGKRSTTIVKDETIGALSVTMSADKSVTIKANTEIKLECGASRLVLKTDGTITLEGVQVSVKGNATLGLEGGASTEVKSSGILQVQGTMVKIN